MLQWWFEVVCIVSPTSIIKMEINLCINKRAAFKGNIFFDTLIRLECSTSVSAAVWLCGSVVWPGQPPVPLLGLSYWFRSDTVPREFQVALTIPFQISLGFLYKHWGNPCRSSEVKPLSRKLGCFHLLWYYVFVFSEGKTFNQFFLLSFYSTDLYTLLFFYIAILFLIKR